MSEWPEKHPFFLPKVSPSAASDPVRAAAKLTDEQIEAIWQSTPTDGIQYVFGDPAKDLRIRFARAILATRDGSASEDAQRLDWLMRQICCDDLGLSLPLVSDSDTHYKNFRAAIDAAMIAQKEQKA